MSRRDRTSESVDVREELFFDQPLDRNGQRLDDRIDPLYCNVSMLSDDKARQFENTLLTAQGLRESDNVNRQVFVLVVVVVVVVYYRSFSLPTTGLFLCLLLPVFFFAYTYRSFLFRTPVFSVSNTGLFCFEHRSFPCLTPVFV